MNEKNVHSVHTVVQNRTNIASSKWIMLLETIDNLHWRQQGFWFSLRCDFVWLSVVYSLNEMIMKL